MAFSLLARTLSAIFRGFGRTCLVPAFPETCSQTFFLITRACAPEKIYSDPREKTAFTIEFHIYNSGLISFLIRATEDYYGYTFFSPILALACYN